MRSNLDKLIVALNKAVAAAEPPAQARVCGKCPAWTQPLPMGQKRRKPTSLRRIGLGGGQQPCGPGYHTGFQDGSVERSFLSNPATTPMPGSKLYAVCTYITYEGSVRSTMSSLWSLTPPSDPSYQCAEPPSFVDGDCWVEVPPQTSIDTPIPIKNPAPPTTPF
jgi:hypothetical protein